MTRGRYDPNVDVDPGWVRRALQDLQRQINERNGERRFAPKTTWVQAYESGKTLTTAWTEYLRRSVALPTGYNTATVLLTASAQVDIATQNLGVGSSIGAQPMATGFAGIFLQNGRTGTGVMGVGAATAFTKTGLTAGFDLFMNARADPGMGSFAANSGAVSLSAVVTFTRE